MITFMYTIKDEHGLHARPAGAIVNCAKGFSSDITVEKDGKVADAKKLLSVMSLAGKHGEQLKFTVSGEDEAAAAEQLERLCHETIG